jgi:hypothetical protein
MLVANGERPVSEGRAINEYRLTDHARLEMRRRGISESEIARVLSAPEQVVAVRAARWVYQSRVEMDDPWRLYLLRVFVDVDRQPPEVVTAYRTSKIDKYWRPEP